MLRLGFLAGLVALAMLAGCVEKVETGAENVGDSFTPGGGTRADGPGGASGNHGDQNDSGSGDGSGSGSDAGSGSGSGSDGDSSGVPPVPNRTIAWADPGDATIRPGVVIDSDSGQCTSNFVFTDAAMTRVFLGFAAHCVADGEPTDTNGCEGVVKPHALGSEVEVEGASNPATLAYTSWGTMQAEGEQDGGVCANNDFAVVELHPDDWERVNPAMLKFGGPTALATSDDARFRSKLLSYGHSSLRLGTEPLNPREGYVLGTYASGWGHDAVFVTSGVPGDSGSGVLTGDGRALGILVTLGAGTNGVANLNRAMEYARTHGGPDLVLATWDAMDDGLLPSL